MPYIEVREEEGMRKIKSVYLCIYPGCGEEIGFVKRKYCNSCLTKAGRDLITKETEIIKVEN